MRQIGQVLDHFREFIDRARIRIAESDVLAIPSDKIHLIADVRAKNVVGLDAIFGGMRIIYTDQNNAAVGVLLNNNLEEYLRHGDARPLRIARTQIEWLIGAVDIGVAEHSVRTGVDVDVHVALGHEFLQAHLHLQPIAAVER